MHWGWNPPLFFNLQQLFFQRKFVLNFINTKIFQKKILLIFVNNNFKNKKSC